MMAPVQKCGGCSMLSIGVFYTVMVAFCGAFPGPGTGSGGETTTIDPSIVSNPFHDPYYHHHPPQNLPPPIQMVYDYSSPNQAGQPANTQNYPASNQHPNVPASNPPAPSNNQNQQNSQPTQYQYNNDPNQYQYNSYPNQYQYNTYPSQYQHNNYPNQYQNNYYPNQAGLHQYPTTTLPPPPPPPQPSAQSQGGAEEYEMEDGRGGGMANTGSAMSYGSQLSANPPPQYNWHYGNYGVDSYIGSRQQQPAAQSNVLPLLYLALTSF